MLIGAHVPIGRFFFYLIVEAVRRDGKETDRLFNFFSLLSCPYNLLLLCRSQWCRGWGRGFTQIDRVSHCCWLINHHGRV